MGLGKACGKEMLPPSQGMWKSGLEKANICNGLGETMHDCGKPSLTVHAFSTVKMTNKKCLKLKKTRLDS